MYGFDTDDQASAFLSMTAATAQCPSFPDFELSEAEFDGFGDDSGTSRVKWQIRESSSVGGSEAPNADEALALRFTQEYRTRLSGTDYGAKLESVRSYERYGRIVLVLGLSGQCCYSGYADVGTAPQLSPSLADLAEYAPLVRPIVLEKLRNGNLIR